MFGSRFYRDIWFNATTISNRPSFQTEVLVDVSTFHIYLHDMRNGFEQINKFGEAIV